MSDNLTDVGHFVFIVVFQESSPDINSLGRKLYQMQTALFLMMVYFYSDVSALNSFSSF
jgi:hypothetical protein